MHTLNVTRSTAASQYEYRSSLQSVQSGVWALPITLWNELLNSKMTTSDSRPVLFYLIATVLTALWFVCFFVSVCGWRLNTISILSTSSPS